MLGVRFHGRGGQDVVTTAELLPVAAFLDGHEAQAFPSFGSERMGAPVLSSAASRRFPTTHGHRVLAPALVVLGVGAVFGSWVTGRVASGSVAVSYLVVSCRQLAPDDKGATPQAEAACDSPGRDDLFLSVVANLARFHREHDKHYAESPLHDAITLQRSARAFGMGAAPKRSRKSSARQAANTHVDHEHRRAGEGGDQYGVCDQLLG